MSQIMHAFLVQGSSGEDAVYIGLERGSFFGVTQTELTALDVFRATRYARFGMIDPSYVLPLLRECAAAKLAEFHIVLLQERLASTLVSPANRDRLVSADAYTTPYFVFEDGGIKMRFVDIAQGWNAQKTLFAFLMV